MAALTPIDILTRNGVIECTPRFKDGKHTIILPNSGARFDVELIPADGDGSVEVLQLNLSNIRFLNKESLQTLASVLSALADNMKYID